MKKNQLSNRLILFAAIFFFGQIEPQAQVYIEPCVMPLNSTPSVLSFPANCLNSSTAYSSTYSKPQKYIPVSGLPGDPIITLKLTLHIFNDINGNGVWVNNSNFTNGVPALNSMLSFITNGQTDRMSQPRSATYTSPTFISQLFPSDSRLQYEVTNIYFYNIQSLYTTPSDGALFAHINSIDPQRLEE